MEGLGPTRFFRMESRISSGISKLGLPYGSLPDMLSNLRQCADAVSRRGIYTQSLLQQLFALGHRAPSIKLTSSAALAQSEAGRQGWK